MDEIVRQWLESLNGHDACLACAVRPPNQGYLQRCWDPTIEAAALDHASRSALDMFRVLRLHRLPSQYLQWTFQTGVLHCVRREDDWVLVVVARRDPVLPEDLLTAWVGAFLGLS